MERETRYVRSGDVSIAYQVVGEGPLDLVYVPGGSHHVELDWENPPQARFFKRLSSVGRLLLFDKRGTGMSDRVAGLPTLETRMDDIRAVLEAASSERAVLFTSGDAGRLGALFAATYPERTSALVLFNLHPRSVRSPDLPWLPTRTEVEQEIEDATRDFGRFTSDLEALRRIIPSATDDELERMTRVDRLSLTPGALATYMRMSLDEDVRDVLPAIRVPTLVAYRAGLDVSRVDLSGQYVAEHITGARLVALPGADLPPMWGDQERLFAELESFIEDVLQGGQWEAEPDRVLATVLFTDVVGSTARAAELGDHAWRQLLRQHHERVRAELGRFRGKEIDTAGDGFFATFDGPARAITCACEILRSVGELGLEVRAGLHTGECEVLDEKVGGIAVHIGARVVSAASPGEVLVSSTVKDLVAGSGLSFQDRGTHALKGVPGEWRLYAVDDFTRGAS